jgi:hypothetical protein
MARVEKSDDDDGVMEREGDVCRVSRNEFIVFCGIEGIQGYIKDN